MTQWEGIICQMIHGILDPRGAFLQQDYSHQFRCRRREEGGLCATDRNIAPDIIRSLSLPPPIPSSNRAVMDRRFVSLLLCWSPSVPGPAAPCKSDVTRNAFNVIEDGPGWHPLVNRLEAGTGLSNKSKSGPEDNPLYINMLGGRGIWRHFTK